MSEKMDQLTDIDEIINMLDAKTEAGVSRIKVVMDEKIARGDVEERYHHGRCDVCSPFATGLVRNEDLD